MASSDAVFIIWGRTTTLLVLKVVLLMVPELMVALVVALMALVVLAAAIFTARILGTPRLRALTKTTTHPVATKGNSLYVALQNLGIPIEIRIY